MPARLIDLTGKRFGKWTVVAYHRFQRTPCGHLEHYWLCRCDCGNESAIVGGSLRQRRSRGCFACGAKTSGASRATHNGAHTRLYGVWGSMLSRCNNPTDSRFKNYGARGIKVCQRWHNFEAFRADVGNPPLGKSIDRRDVDGDYEPGNVRWATPKQQARNKRNNRIVTLRGHKMCLSEAAEVLGVRGATAMHRLRRGWPMLRALGLKEGVPDVN